MTNSTEWFRNHPGKASEYNRKYMAKPGVRDKVILRKHEWYVKNQEERRAKNREAYYRISPEQHLLNSSKGNARKFGREHSITIEDIIIPEICPILGVPLSRGKGRMHGNSPTLDRVDNTKGYVPGNVRVISLKANSHKSDMSKQDIERLYNYVFGLGE